VFRTRQPQRLPGAASRALAALVVATLAVAACSTLIKAPPPSAGAGPPTRRKAARAPSGVPHRPSGKPDKPAACPDLADREALAAVDFSADFGLSADDAQALTAGLIAAAGMEALSARLDADLRVACTSIARELGERPRADGVEAACAAAVKGIDDARTRLGGKARFSLAYLAPRCGLPAQPLLACLNLCAGAEDDSATGDALSTRLDCPGQASTGTCEGQCDGSCDATEGMVCDGKCLGGCDWGFRGDCDGTCVGTCNGRASRGICAGRCVGQCFGLARHGICSGRCLGPCQLRRPAPCSGLCGGRCSTAWKGLQCDSVPRTAPAAAACGPSCEIDAAAAARCSSARVTVTIDMAARNMQARARHLSGVLERFLPAIVSVSVGMKDRTAAASRTADTAFRSSERIIADAAARGGPGTSLSACAGGTLRNGLGALAKLNTSVRVAAEVKAAADSRNARGHRRG